MQYFNNSKFFSFPLRLAMVSLLYNFSIEASLIFLPLYAQDLGASRLDVGLIAAAYGMAYFVSSFIFGRRSDMHGRMGFIRWGLALSAVAYVFQIFAPSPMILLAIRGAIGFCLGVASASMVAYVYEAGGRVGSFASYGSLGWLFGAVMAAAARNYEALFIASSVGSAIAFLISLTLREEVVTRIKVAVIPVGVIWTNRKIYLPFLLRHMGATAIWAIFPLYLAGIGADKLMIAIINGINMGGQFIFMRLIQRFNPVRIFTMGLLVSILVFAIYGIANNYLQLIPVQVLLALAWSGMFIGALNYLLARNVERGTAVGMLYSSMSLSGGIGPFIGGAVSQVWGFSTLMFVSSGLSFVGLLASRGLGKKKETPRT
ncbi:MAG TPA: MFS transporter [Dehalococcoidia bacterium]|nr:MFS transporter [Dehalococcoidia bacterium]